MSIPKTFVFVDGENLVMRYQAMLEAGARQKSDIKHIKDTFVWHPRITTWSCMDIIRVTYYTSATGDLKRLSELKREIASTSFKFSYAPDNGVPEAEAQLVPRIFHKGAKSRKTRNVDINIVIDVMRAAHLNSCELIYLLSGDGDYLPLIEEVMRLGKQVYLCSFSSGLNENLISSVDLYETLDDVFFKSVPKNA